jgi:tetratricopeptide (TPR) repeat protein
LLREFPKSQIFTLQSAANRQWMARELGELVGRGLPQHIRARLQAGEPISYSEQPPVVKVIISLREDYLGTLQELADEVPQILENRFRLTAMSPEQAHPAVVEPPLLPQGELFATRPFSYEDDAVDKMLAFLEGKTGEVEPFQLQLLCRQVELRVAEEQAKGRESIRVDHDYLGGKAKMQAILQNFYLDTIGRLPSWWIRRQARKLCEEGLSDAKGHCRILEEEHIENHYGVGEATLRALVDARLLRKEVRSESFYYELSHGNLAQPVQDSRRWRMPRRWKIILGACLGAVVVLAFVALEESVKIRAIEAQEEAERLMGYLIYGDQDEMEVYKRISAYYEKRGNQGQKIEKLIRHSAVYIKQGDLSMDQPDLQGAWQYYQKALELAERASRRDPNNAESQSYLSVNHERLGDVLVKRGDLDGALAGYRTSLKINEQLAQHDPNNAPQWQHDLSISYNKVGDVLKALGNLDSALDAYQASLKIRQELAQRDPNNIEWQRSLWSSYTIIGEVYRQQGNLEEAKTNDDKALSIKYLLDNESHESVTY